MTATRIKVPRTALETVGLECCGQLMERDGDKHQCFECGYIVHEYKKHVKYHDLKCSKCGKHLGDPNFLKYCGNCGAKFEEAEKC